ncbi:MAG TPA: hypothetical protein VGF14_04140 [Alphaproteobacteria bacterium]
MVDILKNEKDVYNDLNKREREQNKGTGFDSSQDYMPTRGKHKASDDYPHGNLEHTADDLEDSKIEDSMRSRSKMDSELLDKEKDIQEKTTRRDNR